MFKVGDKVRIYSFSFGYKTGILREKIEEVYWIVGYDEPYHIGEYYIKSNIYHKDRLELIGDTRKRILNLEIDPYGEENWYV